MRILLVVISFLLIGCSGSGESKDPVAVNTEATILVIGQSNISNNYIHDYVYQASATTRLDSNGNFVQAVSPVGITKLATGVGSSFLPYMGDLIVQRTKYTQVRIINVAVAASSIRFWIPNIGPVSYSYPPYDNVYEENGLFERIRRVKDFEYTHVIFQIGETDAVNNMAKDVFKSSFIQVVNGIRELGINAPVYLARVSYMNSRNNPVIIQAQNELIQEGYANLGPYTDSLGPEYRFDGVHFSPFGMQNLAEMWSDYLN